MAPKGHGLRILFGVLCREDVSAVEFTLHLVFQE